MDSTRRATFRARATVTRSCCWCPTPLRSSCRRRWPRPTTSSSKAVDKAAAEEIKAEAMTEDPAKSLRATASWSTEAFAALTVTPGARVEARPSEPPARDPVGPLGPRRELQPNVRGLVLPPRASKGQASRHAAEVHEESCSNSIGHGMDRGELGAFLFTAERFDPMHAALAVLLGLYADG
jgi:hypothetical protein